MLSPGATVNDWSSLLFPTATGRPGLGVVVFFGVMVVVRSAVAAVSIFAVAPTNGRVDGPTCHSKRPDFGTTVVVSSLSLIAIGAWGPSAHCGATLNGAAPTPRLQYSLVLVTKSLCRRSV